MRDMETNPYRPDEQRVANYLWEMYEGKVGGGDDPIGFLIASHDAMTRMLREIHETTNLRG